MKVKIKVPEGIKSYGVEVYLDGKQIKGVTGISFKAKVDEFPEVTISFIPEELDLEGEFDFEEGDK